MIWWPFRKKGPVWLDESACGRVVAAIGEAERGNRGEVRVHLEARCRFDPVERAHDVFGELEMYETAEGTGVLLYLSVEDRRVAVFSGPGIPGITDPAFWEPAVDAARDGLREGALADGLVAALGAIGDILRASVPGEAPEGNQRPDTISFG